MASELCSVHIVLETWIISVNNLKKVGVRLVVAKVDIISWKGCFPREHLFTTHILFCEPAKMNVPDSVK